MSLLSAITAFFQAATAYFERWQLWRVVELDLEIHAITNEIYKHGKSGTAADLLRIDELARHREQLRALRSAISDTDPG